MREALLDWLGGCPLISELSVGTLPPGVGTGLFEGGIQSVEQDILGNSRIARAYILRHRDRPDSLWVLQFSLWVVQNQPPALTVIPKGGKTVPPTNEGWATWELELTVRTA